jgi:phosphoglycerol transferase MdoB-like AlkP superfamily enzyme
VAGGSGVTGFRPNALFETLAKRGYIINAFSPNNFSYCDDRATTTIRFGKCVIHGHGLKHFHNEFMILHNFMRKMRLLTMYAAIARVFGLQEINVTAFPGAFQTVVSVNEFIDFLGEGKRGNAYFIHLIVSHSAYVFDEKCSYKDDWNFFKKQEMDETYARYLKQIQCTHVIVDKIINQLNSNPETKDSTIIISGDHGSRIPSSAKSVDFFLSEEYIQFYSTFFAVHSPSFSPSYDKRPFALDELFKVFSVKEPNLLELESKKEKFVYKLQGGTSTNRSQAYTRFTLPPFSNGSKVQSW